MNKTQTDMLGLLYVHTMKLPALAALTKPKRDKYGRYKCVDSLVEDGYVTRSKRNQMTITEDGAAYVKNNLFPVVRTARSAPAFVAYKPPLWHVRTGGNEHLQIASKGLL